MLNFGDLIPGKLPPEISGSAYRGAQKMSNYFFVRASSPVHFPGFTVRPLGDLRIRFSRRLLNRSNTIADGFRRNGRITFPFLGFTQERRTVLRNDCFVFGGCLRQLRHLP